MNRLVSHGSYILVEPLETPYGGVYKGKVYSNIMKHQLNMDQIVYYLEKDITKINFKNKNLHVILHYHIFYKEVEVKEKKIKNDTVEFGGMIA